MKRMITLLLAVLAAACARPTEAVVPTASPAAMASPQPDLEGAMSPAVLTDTPAATLSATTAEATDVFTRMGITLPAPVCASLTQPQTE